MMLRDWHSELNRISGEMSTCYARPLPPRLLIDWAERLLIVARTMRKEAESKEREKR